MRIEWILDEPVESSLLSLMRISAAETLRREGIDFPCCISARICSDETIRSLNASCRGIDRATDVLSFPSVRWKKGETAGQNPRRLKSRYDDEMGACFLGDAVFSLQRIREQAREYGHSEAREAAYLMTHSVCHLLGYDHMDEEEKKQMRKREEEVMDSIGLPQENGGRISDEALLSLAREAMTESYSPYSHFPVGAALLASDGRIFLGCNIENAAYGACICAEQSAVAKAVSEGAREFETIAIATGDLPGWPCGICRQILSEFAPRIRVLVTWGRGEHVEESTLDQILPHQFTLKG